MSTTAVTITRKRETRSIAENISLGERLTRVDQAQICRTCVNETKRDWAFRGEAKVKALMSGVKPEEMLCSPEKELSTSKVLQTTDPNRQILPLDFPTAQHTVAVVSSCGQNLQSKCKNCEHLQRITVSIPYDPDGGKITWTKSMTRSGETFIPIREDGTRPYFWKVTVGGHCSIPAKGIQVDGETRYCDPKPRKYAIENPSCSNCYYQWTPHDAWMFDHLVVNEHAALNPWEREQAMMANPDANPGSAYGIALFKKQNTDVGRTGWFSALLLNVERGPSGAYYTIKFEDSLLRAKFGTDDPRWELFDIPTPEEWDEDKVGWYGKRVVVSVRYPYHLRFGLALERFHSPLVWPRLPEKITTTTPDPLGLVSPSCPACSVKPRPQPCYFHAKGPVKLDTIDEIVFTNPDGIRHIRVMPPHGELSVVKRGEDYVAVDGNGALPSSYGTENANASVFRMYLPSLIAAAKRMGGTEAASQIHAQYRKVVKGLRRGPSRRLRTAWLMNSSRDPSKPHCSHPEGLDLRAQFRDAFGSERTDWDFDTGLFNKMAVNEEVRAGTRQHNQTPQRLQEEIMANIISHPAYDPVTEDWNIPDFIARDPADFFVTKIDAIGNMTYPDGTPITSVSEFMRLLDEDVEIGDAGEVTRKLSRRQQLFGYMMTRGYYGKRRGFEKVANPSLDSDFVIFEHDKIDLEQEDQMVGWECPRCHSSYGFTDVNPTYPECDSCGSDLYRTHTAREVFNPRSVGGVGVAILPDSQRSQQRRRLEDFVCPQWRLNSSSKIIRLEDCNIPGQTDTEEKKERYADKVQVFQVGTLSEEMRKSNDAYEAKLAAVVKQRQDYLSKHPDITPGELHIKFPTPSGTVYRTKSAGSLSKMGGV